MNARGAQNTVIRLLRLITRSLILLLIALFSALAAMRFAIHGREVRVPNLKGLTVLQAQEMANQTGLIVTVDDKFYSSYVPEGKIINQAPAANSKVRRGWRVRVAESLGEQRVVVPDLVGQTERAATLNLRRRGLEIATVAEVPVMNVPANQVVAQVPSANAAQISSPKVSILVAQASKAPEFVMPNFVGRQLVDAKQKVARAGLQIASIAPAAADPTEFVGSPTTESGSSVLRPSPKSGRIVGQSPPAGARVSSETQIHFDVAQ